MADTKTVLNPGVGGDAMDESLVTTSEGPVKRPRVVVGFDDGTLQTKTVDGPKVKADVSDEDVAVVLTAMAQAQIDGTQVTQVVPAAVTLNNGATTAVSNVAVQILAANAARNTAFVQNTGLADIRVGVTGVTATTGLRLGPNDSVKYDAMTQAIFAIRDGSQDSFAFAMELV